MPNATPPTPDTGNRQFGMQISADMDTQITDSAARHNLSKSAIARLALERGLVVVNELLNQPEKDA